MSDLTESVRVFQAAQKEASNLAYLDKLVTLLKQWQNADEEDEGERDRFARKVQDFLNKYKGDTAALYLLEALEKVNLNNGAVIRLLKT